MQRLFSTFPRGLPGVGLVLLRLATALPLVHAGLLSAFSPLPSIIAVMTAGVAILVLIGLWTPIAGALIAVAELGLAVSSPADPWRFLQCSVLGAALALLGPGAWSLDARLFGRREIQIPLR